MALKTDYKEDILASGNTKRKYNMITNDDGTVSFEDVTDYEQTGDTFGAADINNTNTEIQNLDYKFEESLKVIFNNYRVLSIVNIDITGTFPSTSASSQLFNLTGGLPAVTGARYALVIAQVCLPDRYAICFNCAVVSVGAGGAKITQQVAALGKSEYAGKKADIPCTVVYFGN